MLTIGTVACRGVVLGGFLAVIAGGLPVRAAGLDAAPGFEGMRERWAGLLEEFNVPGMAIAIVKDGKVLAIETFGVRVPAEAGSAENAPTADTMYYIASITKTYLATAICALADEGKLSLDDPVQKYLPKFVTARKPEATAKITIRDLLTHQAGFREGEPIVTLDAYTGEITEDRYYHWLAMFKPTGQTEYSNIHYTLLGRIVEAVTGKAWRDFLEERIFQPAGLTRTTGYASRMYGDANCAMPMERTDGQWQVCKLRKTDRTMHAAGGLGASANDAARWLILHMNDGEIDGKRVFSRERAREMRQLQGKLPEKQGSIRIMEGFGLGWQVGTFHGTPLCSHGGGYVGTATYYAFLPEKKSGFAVLMNAGGSARGLQDVIAVDILDRLMDDDERVDVLTAYQKRLAENNAQSAKRIAERNAEMARPLALSRPAGSYAGRYVSDVLGTMTIAADGSRLKATAGECELEIAAAGNDEFKVLGPTFDDVVFKFVGTPGGDVTALSVDLPERGTVVFKK